MLFRAIQSFISFRLFPAMFDDTGGSQWDVYKRPLPEEKRRFPHGTTEPPWCYEHLPPVLGQQEHTSPGGTGIGSGLAFVGMFLTIKMIK